MSQRGKRQASRLDDGPVVTKRRKGRSVAVAEEEEATLEGWTPRSHSDLKMSTIYNRSATEAPAELFRKDLISAMKLPDSEPLSADEYWVINDQWKQEWEKGVQVPVKPDSLPGPSVTVVSQTTRSPFDFKLPKNKYIRITKDDAFKTEEHYLSPIPSKAEKVCKYDLDNLDVVWLKILNSERTASGYQHIREEQFERVIEELEIRSWDKVQAIVKSEEGLGIEFDENVICDVCRSPDSEEGNEMVFCDSCNICVHQACYGITTIPAGSWLCRTCALGQRPECVLCPNRGGAMKCTRSGQKWAHVSCALWIPEVSIGCVEKMEPITKISSIPQSRWALICVLCRERVGACIQCSVKTCKVAYHVTCAFKHGLEMRAIIEDENADDGVKLRSYCEKHSVNPKKDHCGSISEDDECKRKKRKDMTSEEKNQARAAKLQEIEGEFEKHVSPGDVSKHHDVDIEGVTAIYNYWILKRRAGNNKPLVAPRSDDVDFLNRQQGQAADQEKMKMFVQLRQDLERVRNLCYMVSRREKLSRTFFRMREQTFHKQIAILSDSSHNFSAAELTAIKEANHGPSLYDKIYSHPSAPELSTDFETVLARIAGVSPNEKGKIDKNGMRKKSDNPYKRMYMNGGLERRRSLYTSMSSGSDTDIKRQGVLDTSSGESSKTTTIKGKRLSKKRSTTSHSTVDTSTEDEGKSKSWTSPRRSKGLLQMEEELGDKTGSDDSDDLIMFSQVKKDSRSVTNIYSDTDSDSSGKDDQSENSHPMRTKAAMKEFTAINKGKHKKSQVRSSSKMSSRIDRENQPDSSIEDDYYKDKENVNISKKKKKDSSAPSDLIVPQRQAAKKASESIRQGKVKGESVLVEQDSVKTMVAVDDNKIKLKSLKSKGKEKEVIKDKSSQKEDKSKTPNNDIYAFDNDLGVDGQDIIAYVPQRQAARKATECIKSGLNKPGTNETESEPPKPKVSSDTKPKKENEIVKPRKEEPDKNKKVVKTAETKGRKSSKSSVSSSSSSSSCSSSSGSSSSSSSSSSESAEEEEDEEEKKPDKVPQEKKSLFDPIPSKEEDKAKPPEKKPEPKKKIEMTSFIEKEKRSIRSSSSSSSSDSDDSVKPPPPKKNEIINKTKSIVDSKKDESNKSEVHKDDSSLKVGMVTKKLRKTPEKKLKTSDGRPELEFQQPPTERKESSSRTQEQSRSEEKSRRKIKTERGCSPGSNESKTIYNSNKIQSSKDGSDRNKSKGTSEDRTKSQSTSSKPTTVSSDRSKSEIFKRDNEKGKDEQSKKDIQSRKRKPDDSEKEALSHKPSRKSSPHSKDHSLIEEKTRQRSPTPSKKTDKKIDSPAKKNEGSLTSTLEQEIIERKAGRDITSKSNSKKSLDRLFEKRDKLFRENVLKEQNALKNSVCVLNKSPEKLLSKSPEKINQQVPKDKDIIVKDENKNDKIDDKSWVSFNNNSSINLLEPLLISKQDQDTFETFSQRSLFSPEPEQIIEQIKLEEKKSADAVVTMSNAPPPILIKEDTNDQLPVLSPTPVVHQDSLFKNDSIPQLEKADVANASSDFPTIDLDRPEPKKVKSRTPSLSGPPQQRSIFSPQPPSKDVSAPEIIDFENNVLTVDEDGFMTGISRDSEGRASALSLSFSSNDFLFRIGDSKEENARETMNLVEKLRMGIGIGGYPKKSQNDSESDIENKCSNIHLEEPDPIDPKSLDEIKLDQSVPNCANLQVAREAMALMEPNIPDEIKQNTPDLDIEEATKALDPEETMNLIKPIMDEAALRVLGSDPHLLPTVGTEKHDAPAYESNDHYQYHNYPISIEVNKVPGREKIDRSNSAQADERWVPPSVAASVHSYDPVPSPYRNKWADSEIMPSRHSSSSSASSSSSSSHRDEMEQQKHEDLGPPIANPSLIQDIIPPFSGLQPQMSYNPSCALTNSQAAFHFPETSSFPVPYLQPPTCSQIQFTTGGTTLFPPNFTTSYSSQHPLVNKLDSSESLHMPPPPPCSAAFTASSHNMAITAAMVAPITGAIMQEPLTPLPFPSQDNCQEVTPELLPPPTPEILNHQPPTSVSSEEPPTPKSVGKKSPLKPTRTSARCIAQQTKSPAKSPGKSPRQMDSRGRGRDSVGKRGRPPGRVNQRGRGRGRGRGRSHAIHNDNTITSKLVGTVYDFDFDEDEDGGDSLENLRAMRERRKSSEVHEKKSDTSSYLTKDSPHSPKLMSPLHHKNRSGYNSDTKGISPILNQNKSNISEPTRIVDIVEPLLPGPVDMRTYSSFTSNTSTYQNHLLESFSAVPPPEPPTTDYVKDLEEEINNLRSATTSKIENEPVPKVLVDDLPQVSVDDSRNQLKVKIKGPFLDARYSASSGITQVRPSAPSIAQTEGATVPLGPSSSVTSSSGSSNLRRMRKKELLRQYWNQDMNMDENVTSVPPAVPTQDPLVNRTVITIPKAVASMPIVPTREDYKAVVDANMEKKRKKEKALSSREPEEIVERRKSITSTLDCETTPQPQKRRGRAPRGGLAPKLKIKIGGDGNNQMSVSTLPEERKNLRVRPPKKRVRPLNISVNKPTIEEMRRESMKYRKKVMADFDEEEDNNTETKSRKRKRKSFDDPQIVRVINNESAPKLIIRFSKRPEETVNLPSPPSPQIESEPLVQPSSECDDRTSDDNPAVKKVRTSKVVTPIKLKLSRCEEGYVMKVPVCDSVGKTGSDLSPTETRDKPPALTLSKDCEVR